MEQQVKWVLNFKHHMCGTMKGIPYFPDHKEEETMKEWVDHYSPFAEKINAEGGYISAYVIEGGFKLRPKLEGISHELKEEIRAAGLRV